MADKVYQNPMIGLGTTLAAGTTIATAFTAAPAGTVALAWIKSVKTGFQMGVVEWQNLATAAKRRMPGIFDGDTISVGLQYLPGDTSNKTLWALFIARTPVVWLVTFPDTSAIAFNGFVSKVSPASEDTEDEVDAEVEIAVDGIVGNYPVAGP